MFNEFCYPKESDMFRSDMKGFTVFSLIFLTNTNFDGLNQIKLSLVPLSEHNNHNGTSSFILGTDK